MNLKMITSLDTQEREITLLEWRDFCHHTTILRKFQIAWRLMREFNKVSSLFAFFQMELIIGKQFWNQMKKLTDVHSPAI